MLNETSTPEFKTWFSSLVATRAVDITFSKKDGSIRKMICTTAPHLLPEYIKHASYENPNIPTSTTMIIFDLAIDKWRSFVWENLIDIKFEVNSPD